MNEPPGVPEPMTTKPTQSAPPSRIIEPSGQKTWTVRGVLEWTTDFFRQHELASARLDAEVLLAHVLGKDRLALYLRYEDVVPPEALQAYRELIRRRLKREPVAYLTGVREFYGISFSLDPSVLIPRPETEHLVEYVLRYVEGNPGLIEEDALRLLEIGTGCGNLCISLAERLPRARIVSVDISSAAIAAAARNVRAHPASQERIRLVQGDLLEGLDPQRARFHLIVSNPPYVATESWQDLPPEVRNFEPRIALDGGRRGTEILEKLVKGSARHLLPGGALVLEIGETQAEELLGVVEHTGAYRQARILEDYAGKPRVLVATAKERV